MDDKMNTYSGREISPLAMTRADVSLDDIAHALSLMCRGGGHVRYFYSVAQHCINCAHEAEAREYDSELVLMALLHDASEAYVADVIRPIKRHLANYIEIEDGIIDVILGAFGISAHDADKWAKVKQIDDDMMYNEIPAMLADSVSNAGHELFSTPDFRERNWREVEAEYKDYAGRLVKELGI